MPSAATWTHSSPIHLDWFATGDQRCRTPRIDIGELADPGFGDTGHVRVGDGDCRDRVTGDIRERLKIAGIFFSGHAMSPFNGRAGKDVMELVEQQCLPDAINPLSRVHIVGRFERSHGTEIFNRAQHRFFLATSAFHLLLRGQRLAMQLEIEFAFPSGHFRAGLGLHLGFSFGEEVVRSAVFDFWHTFKTFKAVLAHRHFTDGPAAAIAIAE